MFVTTNYQPRVGFEHEILRLTLSVITDWAKSRLDSLVSGKV